MLTIFLSDLLATQRLGFWLGKHLPPNSVIFLSGNLGAGKTSLVQGIGKGLEIEDSIVSPTFTLINEYLDGRLPLYHLDLYRLKPSQVDSIYPEMYWEGREVEPGITAIEWWDRLTIKPTNYWQIELVHCQNGREAKIEQQGKHSLDLASLQNFFKTNQKTNKL